MEIFNVFPFSSGFTFTDRDTGEVLVEATDKDARELQRLMEAGKFTEGAHPVGDRIADIHADVCMGERKVLIDVDNSVTACALVTRLASGIKLAVEFGTLDEEESMSAYEFVSTACDLPTISFADMAEQTAMIFMLSELSELAGAVAFDEAEDATID